MMLIPTIVFSDIPNNYLIFQQVAEDSVLSGKLSEKAMLTAAVEVVAVDGNQR